MKIDYTDFAKTTLSTYQLSGFRIDITKALNSIQEELEETMTDLNSEATKQARHTFFDIENTNAEDYTEHIISLNDKQQIICGIRHKSGNKDKAFVHVETNFQTSKNELLSVYNNHLSSMFEKFKPKHLRYYTKHKSTLNINSHCFMIQQASVIKNMPSNLEEAEMELKTPEIDNYYDWYAKGYADFHKQYPALKIRVPTQSKALFKDSLKDDLLKLVFYQGERIGLIAADRSPFLGHAGIYFNEIFIDAKWKGKGLAKSIQRKFVDELTNGEEIIWGTIDFENVPSYKTALANKRKAIRFENFLPLN